jgi:hypothetical protein
VAATSLNHIAHDRETWYRHVFCATAISSSHLRGRASRDASRERSLRHMRYYIRGRLPAQSGMSPSARARADVVAQGRSSLLVAILQSLCSLIRQCRDRHAGEHRISTLSVGLMISTTVSNTELGMFTHSESRRSWTISDRKTRLLVDSVCFRARGAEKNFLRGRNSRL